MSNTAKIFVAAMVCLGAAVMGAALLHWESASLVRFCCYALIAVMASVLKVRLPGIDGTMSVNFLFILLGIMELSLPETLVIGCAAGLVQCLWTAQQRLDPVKITFNVSMLANAAAISYVSYHRLVLWLGDIRPTALMIAALIYFVANTLPVSIIIGITENKSFRHIWSNCYFWSFPYYLVGAAVVGLVSFVNRRVGWQTSLLILPIIYWVYRSYRLYLDRLEDEKKRVEIEKQHVEQVASLNLRTIEALALAIEAKDNNTHDHLHRVRTYAVEIGKELGLGEDELEALRAAALLHDIGKLAIPEHIINKPGRLTPEEFEKMKIHPIVGAEILERVAFPYPVVPVVRSHHEKWDGTGYPDGLKGDEISIGARVLAVVDCLDALSTDRQYRNALPLDEAMAKVVSMSGTSFDPAIVEILGRRYIELERMAQTKPDSKIRLSLSAKNLHVEQGHGPATGFESSEPAAGGSDKDFLSSIASARQEAQTLFELSQDLGNSLSLVETLSVLSIRLRKLIPYDSMAIFVCKNGRLLPEFVSGEDFRALSSLNIPVGKGLVGWVAETRKPIINGNPEVESAYAGAGQPQVLRSALAVPVEGLNGVVGVLAMYRRERDSFNADHLRILLAVSSKLGLAIENALKYEQAESSATTDYLTGLPNARSLFLHLSQELSRCQRKSGSTAVMVCDLDGFKQVNDRYGHLEGDKVLRELGAKLKEACRGYDYVARMGGDEFVLVVPGLSPDAALIKAQSLHELTASIGRKICGEDLLGLSVGTAFCPEDGNDAEHLLAEADRRMYSVKQTHRDKAADPDGAPFGFAARHETEPQDV
jgi:diguanylate cyclase (GGDEF)-like protein/putative nucleotidyltransferase with HDIG domain